MNTQTYTVCAYTHIYGQTLSFGEVCKDKVSNLTHSINCMFYIDFIKTSLQRPDTKGNANTAASNIERQCAETSVNVRSSAFLSTVSQEEDD